MLSANLGNLTPLFRVHSGILLVVAADAGEVKDGSSDTPVAAAIAADDLTNASLLSRSRSLLWDDEAKCEAERPEVDDVVLNPATVGIVTATARRAAKKRRCCDITIISQCFGYNKAMCKLAS